jgi:hypothetical protein
MTITANPVPQKLPDWLQNAMSWAADVGNTAEPSVLLPGQTATLLQNAGSISRGLQILYKLDLDFQAINKGWKTENMETKIAQGLDVEAQILNFIGMYIPQAVILSDAVTVAEILIPLAMRAAKAIEKSEGFQKFEKKVLEGTIPDHNGGHVPEKGWPQVDENGNFTGKYS